MGWDVTNVPENLLDFQIVENFCFFPNLFFLSKSIFLSESVSQFRICFGSRRQCWYNTRLAKGKLKSFTSLFYMTIQQAACRYVAVTRDCREAAKRPTLYPTSIGIGCYFFIHRYLLSKKHFAHIHRCLLLNERS